MSLKALLNGQQTSVPYTLGGTSQKNLSNKFFSSVGVPVHTLRPNQNLPLLRLALGSSYAGRFEDDYDLLVNGAGPAFRSEFEMHVRKIIHRDAAVVKFREKPKSLFRMRDKEALMEGGAVGAESHTDINAVMIFAKDIAAFERLTDRLRPSNNANVAQLKEKAANPDENYFPGNTIKYIVEKNFGDLKRVPMVTEIILLMDGCQDYYTYTHDQVEKRRGLSKFWNSNSRGKGDIDVQLSAAYMLGTTGQAIPRVNKEMAKVTGMDSICQDRSYHLIDGIPVTHVVTKKGDNFAFTPDAESGFYVVDNSYLQRISKDTRSSREEFLIRSQDMVPMPDVQGLSGQTAQPLLQLAS